MTKKIETFSFGYSTEDAAPCPELSAFIDEIDAVCEKFGMGFELKGGYDEYESPKMVIVPYENADLEWVAGHLEEYNGGIPALDRAKAEQAANRAARETREREAEARRREKARETKAATEAAQKEAIMRDGVLIDGKRYKLVEAA